MKITFLRQYKTAFGGAENYLERLLQELEIQHINYDSIHSLFPKFLPSWIRVILFNLQVCINKKNKFYFSLERISCPDIYRAGDGVHRVYMEIEHKSIFNPLNFIYLHIEKKMFKHAKKIIAISHMVKNDIINTYKIPSEKIEVIYNGIKIQMLHYDQSFNKISQEFGITKNDKILLFVGSGYKRKGVIEFFEILAKLQYKNFKAFIVGKEKNINYYKAYSKKLNLDNKVIFTGPRKDVNDFYQISDIFLFPTRYEPFGNVILEAMNFSSAVITTKFCGGGEILNQEYIMNNSQDYSIVHKIDELLYNPIKLEEIKKQNYEIVQNFTIEKNAKETMKVIHEYLP